VVSLTRTHSLYCYAHSVYETRQTLGHPIVSDNNLRPVRVMHLVSSEGAAGAAQQALFMPMLTRMPKQRVKMLVVSLSPNAVPGAVLRQSGVPVYDVALSKHRFSTSAFGQLVKTIRAFRPDVIQAWGHTAQLVSQWLRGRCDGETKLVWTVANTAALPRKPGLIDRQKLKYAAKFSKRADSIVYTSEAAASAHRRVGFPEEGHTIIPLGVDPTRFKPDFATRRKVREQLGLAPESFVIGMMAPFQPEYDHSTLFKAIGELIKTEPNVNVLLAGHGVQKGNGPLMALVGGGTLGTRTQLLGEWSDVAAFFNACDLAVSSALTDNGRMSLVVAMLCGIPCVATGMGAQGEVIGQYGVAVEPGSPVALIRGINRVMQMPPDKRVFMAQGARKHALKNFVSIRSLQKYLQLYYDLVGRKLTAASAVPVPEIDATIPQPTPEDKQAASTKPKPNRTVDMYDLADPDSLELRDSPSATAPVVEANTGDVLQMFESTLAKQASTSTSPMSERARGVADEHEDLLSPELTHSDVPSESKGGNKVPAASAAVIAEGTKPVRVSVATPMSVAPNASPPMPVTPALAMATWVAPEVEQPLALAPDLLPIAQVASKATAAPQPPAVRPAEVELTLADTMTVSMKISLDGTGTLEIPPELIFTTSAVAPNVVPAPAVTAAAVAPSVAVMSIATIAPQLRVASASAATIAPVAPSQPSVSSSPIPPQPLVVQVDPQQPAIVAAVEAITADSATVPALAVDAILSRTAALSLAAPADAVSSQLDLLGDAIVEQKLAVGDNG
jgi:glycosyltransferase involved in cell wall biosynthesis